MMLICQVIRLRPTDEQASLYCRHAIAARIARNDLIALWKDEGKRLPGFRYTMRELRPICNAAKQKQRSWFADLSQNAIKGGYIDAEDAIARYYTGQNRRPKFRGKGARFRFRCDNGVGTIKAANGRMMLPRKMGGSVRLGEAMRWTDKPIRECRISERGGYWYASIRQEITPEEYGKHCGEGVLGIDLGLKTFATICHQDGTIEEIHAPEPLKQALTALKRSSRKLSRRKPGSRNRAKARAELARRHCRLADIRKNFLHQMTHRLTAAARIIVVEDLNFNVWQKRWGRKTSDLAPGEFRRQLEYKAEWRGGQTLRVPWNYPSTQLCPDCGAKTGPRDLSVRVWTCVECGVMHVRDHAAARNLQAWPGATGQQTGDSNVRRASARSRGGTSNRRTATPATPLTPTQPALISADCVD